MKKSIILSILGLTAAAASSHAQGSIAFNTYAANGGSGIITTYGSNTGGLAGTAVAGLTGELLWSSVNIADPASTVGNVGNALSAGWTVGSTGTFGPLGPIPAGYIQGPNLTIASAVGTSLYFEIIAFNGASYNNSTIRGISGTFTGTLATGTTLPSGDQLNNMAPFSVFSVAAVPEPTTLALAGLGGLASLVALRRKQA